MDVNIWEKVEKLKEQKTVNKALEAEWHKKVRKYQDTENTGEMYDNQYPQAIDLCK